MKMTGMKKVKKNLLKFLKRWRVLCGVLLVLISTIVIWNASSDIRIVWSLNIMVPDEWAPDSRDSIYNRQYIVPDIVHYILFEKHRISYSNMLSLLSVVRIHKPANIYIHCDCDEIEACDQNWERVLRTINVTNKSVLRIIRIKKPTEINGIKIREDFANFHGSDITRYRLMKQYGGIYLDNDVFVVQPLHEFRKYEFTLNWDEDQYLGSQILIGHKDARFLTGVLETYRAYDTNRWYFNAGELPTRAILWKYPQIIHRVKVKFGVDAPIACRYFYKEYHSDWQTAYYTFHMVMRGNSIYHKTWCLGEEDHPMKNVEFDDNVIRSMNNTFGEMVRHVLFA